MIVQILLKIRKKKNLKSVFSIFHLNTRSIRIKVYGLESLLNKLNKMLKKFVDVVCITESWLLESEIDFIALSGFNIISHFCRSTKDCGGTIIFAKDNMQASPINFANLIQNDQIEISDIVIEMVQSKKMIILNVY